MSGAGLRWLEVAPSYRCNNRCLGCFSANDHGKRLAADRLVAHLREARADGADRLWIGGGEPTLLPKLVTIVRAARELGYRTVKLQTNGMLLAYETLVTQLVDAGLTEVAFSLKGDDAPLHDALTATPGCFELLHQGIARCRAAGLELEGDVLVYRRNAGRLPAIIERFAGEGIRHFRLWLLSAHDDSSPEVNAELLRLTEYSAALSACRPTRERLGVELVSLHAPPCVLAPEDRELAFDARAFAMRVVDAEGYGFLLHDSPMEGGRYAEACEECSARPRCRGLRDGYWQRFGAEELITLRSSP